MLLEISLPVVFFVTSKETSLSKISVILIAAPHVAYTTNVIVIAKRECYACLRTNGCFIDNRDVLHRKREVEFATVRFTVRKRYFRAKVKL